MALTKEANTELALPVVVVPMLDVEKDAVEYLDSFGPEPMVMATMKSPKNRTRDSEIALLEQLSSRLDTLNGAPSKQPVARSKKPVKKSLSDATKIATTNILAVKALVKGMVKACVQEQIATVENETTSIGVIDSLVEEYRNKYSSLTKQMVTDGIARHKKSQEANSSGESNVGENTEEEVNDELKLGRCMDIVDEHMEEYLEKIEALKKRRESAASEPDKSSKKRKSTGEGGDAEASPKRPRGRPKGSKTMTSTPKTGNVGRPKKETPETKLMDEITERYVKARQELDRLPTGEFERIVEQTKKDMDMEDFELTLVKIRKRVTWNYINRPDAAVRNSSIQKKKDIVEEVYQRYVRTKISNGGKLAPGTLEAICAGVKLEMGMPDTKMSTLESKVQARFKKENPDFFVKKDNLSEEQQRRRQVLMNEVTSRYIRAKEEGSKKLPDGELDRIITQTKADLKIEEFDVPKASIRGRIHRKSPAVMTLGSRSPYDVIDAPLVATINNWLSQGISVSRAQGLEFANTLLKGKKKEKDDNGNDIMLDAKWWRNFLERNKSKLVCSSD